MLSHEMLMKSLSLIDSQEFWEGGILFPKIEYSDEKSQMVDHCKGRPLDKTGL